VPSQEVGSQGRVWLATDKRGSKIIGNELHWRVNVREAIRVDQNRFPRRERESLRLKQKA